MKEIEKAMKRFIKYHIVDMAALLLAILSILSNDVEKYKEWTGLGHYLYVGLSLLNDKKIIIGIIAIGIVVITWVILHFLYHPKDAFIKQACKYIIRNNDLAAESELQITIYYKHGWLKTFLIYLKNMFIVLFSLRCWKAGLVPVYLFKKFPNPFKNYYIKDKQYSMQNSNWTPTLYFRETYNDDDRKNGYMSYYLYTHGEKSVSVAKFKSFEPHKNEKYYEGNNRLEYERYTSAMHLCETDLRCLNRASNFVYIAPIDNTKSEHIGAIVIDIDHKKKVNITPEFKALAEHTAKMINIAVNHVE